MRPERLGSYRVVDEIGQGPLTVIYRAVQEPLGRTVAIKALRAAGTPGSPLTAQLEREARLLGGLSSEHVVALHDFVRDGDAMFLVLEHVDGAPLSALIERAPRGLPMAAATAVASAAAAALAHAHERGVVHRDVCPENVLLRRDGAVKLADFGLAYDQRQGGEAEPVEATGGFGAPAYMSPEQILGEAVDARSDVFSLGVVLYQMLAGVRPFEAPDARAVTQRLRHDAPTPLLSVAPGVSPWLVSIVERCLEKAPEHRFASAAALREALEQGAAEQGLDVGRREIAVALQRAGLVEASSSPAAPAVHAVHAGHAVAGSASAAAWASARGAGASRGGVGRAAAGQLFVLFSMVLGGSAIQSNVQGVEALAFERSESLELVPDRPAALRVLARPWATVFVDGQQVDVTPFARPIPLRAGEHEVVLRHPAAPDERRTLKLTVGETALVEVEMKVPPSPAASSPTPSPSSLSGGPAASSRTP